MGKLQQDVGILNDSDVLRRMICETEKMMVSITPASAPAVLRSHTEAHALLDRLADGGADMRAEQSRIETLDDRIVNNAKPIVRAVGGPAAFAALRNEVAGDDASMNWWRLDEVVAAANRSRLIKIGAGVGALLLVLLLGFLMRGVLFPPDPVGDAVFGVQTGLRENDLPRALSAVEIGLTKVPTNTTLLVWQGILLERANDPRSADSFATAQEIAGEERMLLERAQISVMLGDNDRVIADATRALEINPNSAEAYYIRSSGYEGKDDIQRALDDLDKTAQLAEAARNDTLFATARIRSGTLMQRMMGGGGATATP